MPQAWREYWCADHQRMVASGHSLCRCRPAHCIGGNSGDAHYSREGFRCAQLLTAASNSVAALRGLRRSCKPLPAGASPTTA